ncbi:MAG: YqiJ family protein [Colwellia sp.]|nr:YqiJ family protein [Colwellia sp.]
MDQLFNVASQFPTVIYSTLLGVVVIYWLIGMLGLIDLDFAGDIDVDADIDADIDINVGGLTGLFLTFGLTGVPFTLVISIIILICWLISFYLQFYLLSWLPDGWLYYVMGAITDFVVFLVSLPITAVIIRPLKGMFKSVETTTSQNLVGSEATVVTGKVTGSFGQARVFNEGAEILLDVRCDDQHSLSKGDKGLLIEYTSDSHTYIIAPYPH